MAKPEPKLGAGIIVLGVVLFIGGLITLFNTLDFNGYIVMLVGILAMYIGRFIQRGFIVHFYIFGFFPVFINPLNLSQKTHKTFLVFRLLIGVMYGTALIFSLVSNDFKFALLNLVG